MRPRVTQRTPWDRRHEAEWSELAARLERFEHMVMAALHEHDARVAAQRAAGRAAYVIQQTDQVVQRVAITQERIERHGARTAALARVARLVHRDVSWRLLLPTIAVPAVFAAWLWIVWSTVGR